MTQATAVVAEVKLGMVVVRVSQHSLAQKNAVLSAALLSSPSWRGAPQ